MAAAPTVNNNAVLEHPNLLVVGFVKCGTTSIAKYLSDHPEVAKPLAKELYYLIDPNSKLLSMQPIVKDLYPKGLSVPIATKPQFVDFFPDRAGKRYALDATPFYYSQEAALRYAEEYPETKIIFMTRSPEKRLLSSFQYFQNVFQEYPSSSFGEFVGALLGGPERHATYRQGIKKNFFQELFDSELEMGCYEKHISAWEQRVGMSRIFLGRMELLRDRPKEFMANLCEFLDIDGNFYAGYQFSPYMQSYKVRFPALQKLGRKLGKEDPIRYDALSQYQSPFHRLPLRHLRQALEYVYGRIQHRPLSAKDEKLWLDQLSEYYLPANIALRDRYGIDYTRNKKASANSGYRGPIFDLPQSP
jgi:hypothetical protein